MGCSFRVRQSLNHDATALICLDLDHGRRVNHMGGRAAFGPRRVRRLRHGPARIASERLLTGSARTIVRKTSAAAQVQGPDVCPATSASARPGACACPIRARPVDRTRRNRRSPPGTILSGIQRFACSFSRLHRRHLPPASLMLESTFRRTKPGKSR